LDGGEGVARGRTDEALSLPRHTYTRRLLAAVPLLRTSGHESGEPRGEPLLRVSGLNASHGRLPVLKGVDLSIFPGECVALLGESGSGKTTLSRSVVGLHHQFTGKIFFDGQQQATSRYRRTAEQRRRLQYVVQKPHDALHPHNPAHDR